MLFDDTVGLHVNGHYVFFYSRRAMLPVPTIIHLHST